MERAEQRGPFRGERLREIQLANRAPNTGVNRCRLVSIRWSVSDPSSALGPLTFALVQIQGSRAAPNVVHVWYAKRVAANVGRTVLRRAYAFCEGWERLTAAGSTRATTKSSHCPSNPANLALRRPTNTAVDDDYFDRRIGKVTPA